MVADLLRSDTHAEAHFTTVLFCGDEEAHIQVVVGGDNKEKASIKYWGNFGLFFIPMYVCMENLKSFDL